MKILLYGGTFDPPHNGHLNNLRAAAGRVMPDLVVVMPAGVPPHKAASATPAALRLEMCRCFAALEGAPGLPRIAVSDWEIRQAANGRRNYTVLTLEMLARTYPDAVLYLAVGSDMLESFRAWYRWQDILRLARLVVVSRQIGDDAALRRADERGDRADGRGVFRHAVFQPALAGVAADDDLSVLLRDLERTAHRAIYANGLHSSSLTMTSPSMSLFRRVTFSISPGATIMRFLLQSVLPPHSATTLQPL